MNMSLEYCPVNKQYYDCSNIACNLTKVCATGLSSTDVQKCACPERNIVILDNNGNIHLENEYEKIFKLQTDLQTEFNAHVEKRGKELADGARDEAKQYSDRTFQLKGNYISHRDQVAFGRRGVYDENCKGDCRAVVDFWKDGQKWYKEGKNEWWQWNETGAKKYYEASKSNIEIQKINS